MNDSTFIEKLIDPSTAVLIKLVVTASFKSVSALKQIEMCMNSANASLSGQSAKVIGVAVGTVDYEMNIYDL